MMKFRSFQKQIQFQAQKQKQRLLKEEPYFLRG